MLRRLKLVAHARHAARATHARPAAEDAAPGLPAARPAGRGLAPRQPGRGATRPERPARPQGPARGLGRDRQGQLRPALLNELASLRFLDAHHHALIVGPVGVGKTFLAHALGHVACRRGHSVLAPPIDKMLKTLRHARLTNTYEAELRKLLAVDLLILDDFCLDAMDAQESRDAYEILIERHRSRLHHRHLEPRPRRMARDLRRSHPRPERHRPLHQQRLRPRHRGRVLSQPPQARTRPHRLRGPWTLPVSWKAWTASKPLAGVAAHPSHKPLENRPTTAGFPQRPQAAAADHPNNGELALMTRSA